MDIREQLKNKAAELPLRPGVYIMKASDGKVIYVGKSKALRNRVYQYFANISKHNAKTKRMVLSVRSFDYVLTDSEIEALALENKLIKLYTPRYNIRLKDGKSYPYIKVLKEKNAFPVISVTRTRKKDGGKYFGPYSGTKVPYDILETLRHVFGMPSCKHRFPRDFGKVRPCIYSQMGQCIAPCEKEFDKEACEELFERICSFLRGNFRDIEELLKEEMQFASDHLRYETAAIYRDRLKALHKLTDQQKVVGAPGEEYDVLGLYEDEKTACLGILSIRDGAIRDTRYFPIGADTILDAEAVISLLCEIYGQYETVPGELYFEYDFQDEELEALYGYFLSMGHKITVKLPQRGTKKQLCDLASDNAAEHAVNLQKEEEKELRSLVRLTSLLGLEALPLRMESVDISNYGNEEIRAGFVSFENGEPKKSEYRLFKMKEVCTQDDYASMREAVKRRIAHKAEWPLPDLLLLDGGKGHVSTVKEVLKEEKIHLPVFGMVKDDYHKTRALTDGERELSIAGEQGVYMLIYKIQEEVHRFTYGATLKGKRKTLRHSVLENIKGIGATKAKTLLKTDGGLRKIKELSMEELGKIKGISKKDAENIYRYFHSKEEEK